MTAARSRELCVMACVFCKDPVFQKWMQHLASSCYQDGVVSDPQSYGESVAKAFILSMCKVKSRNELDASELTKARFHELVRLPFLAWKEAQ